MEVLDFKKLAETIYKTEMLETVMLNRKLREIGKMNYGRNRRQEEPKMDNCSN